MITFRKNGRGELNLYNVMSMLQEKLGSSETAVIEAPRAARKATGRMETDRQSIDARLNDERQTADEARHKTTHKMMHDLRIL